MRYTKTYSYINVIGKIWMPSNTAAMSYDLDSYQIDNMRDITGELTRDSIASWLDRNTGDFSEVIDWECSIVDGDKTVDYDWQLEGSFTIFSTCMYPTESEVDQ